LLLFSFRFLSRVSRKQRIRILLPLPQKFGKRGNFFPSSLLFTSSLLYLAVRLRLPPDSFSDPSKSTTSSQSPPSSLPCLSLSPLDPLIYNPPVFLPQHSPNFELLHRSARALYKNSASEIEVWTCEFEGNWQLETVWFLFEVSLHFPPSHSTYRFDYFPAAS